MSSSTQNIPSKKIKLSDQLSLDSFLGKTKVVNSPPDYTPKLLNNINENQPNSNHPNISSIKRKRENITETPDKTDISNKTIN